MNPKKITVFQGNYFNLSLDYYFTNSILIVTALAKQG